MIITKRSFLEEDGTPSNELINTCIEEHFRRLPKYQKLDKYYNGEHEILKREFEYVDIPDVKIVCNHAEYITDMAVAYVHGEPIQFTVENEEEQKALDDHYTKIDEDSHDFELGEDISIFGHGLELNYTSDDEKPVVKYACLCPINNFLVVDDSVDHNPMFAVSIAEDYDVKGNKKGYNVDVITDMYILKYHAAGLPGELDLIDMDDNIFGEVSVIEYKNNKRERGDFEGIISLIDAYNILQSDRIADKEQFIDSFLVLINESIGDNSEETEKTIKALRELKVLEMDQDGDAKWLTKALTESDVEVLKKAIKSDIHEFSKVPDMTDENFANNQSGVAMKYKLLGLEQKGNTKERYFKQGLRKRLHLLDVFNKVQSAKVTNYANCDIVMKRSLPEDELEKSTIATNTSDLLSKKTRIRRFDPEIDADEEMDRLQEENAESAKNAMDAMMADDYSNFGGGGVNKDEEKKKDKGNLQTSN